MAGGKLAELGEATLLKAGNKIVDKFFAAFFEYMSRQPRTAPPPPPPEPEAPGLSNSRWSWAVALGVVVVIVGYHALSIADSHSRAVRISRAAGARCLTASCDDSVRWAVLC